MFRMLQYHPAKYFLYIMAIPFQLALLKKYGVYCNAHSAKVAARFSNFVKINCFLKRLANYYDNCTYLAYEIICAAYFIHTHLYNFIWY